MVHLSPNPMPRSKAFSPSMFLLTKHWSSSSQPSFSPLNHQDLRNHGTSPHTEGMNYVDMASDLIRFFKQHDLERVALVGHSM